MYLRRIVHNKTWDFSLFQILIGDYLEALWYHEKNCLYPGNYVQGSESSIQFNAQPEKRKQSAPRAYRDVGKLFEMK